MSLELDKDIIIAKFKPNSTESLDNSSEYQDIYSGESYYEYDSDDKESEETEKESDSKFYDQKAFHQQSFGEIRLRSYKWRTNEASPTMKLKSLYVDNLEGRLHLSHCPAWSYRY
ncbi:hypothetical protein C2G38_2189890 [Gigaspora rosea]|uniref:Uncharacterized protein n=1 Tax=Gigaspora rosea TaxID=44941 RepID=A0A397V229_9GLOM|nr:hypothetical protein C2G38_2189890 [Gigaspora rosea]